MFLGYFVSSVHSMQFPFYILLMTWHYKRLTSYRHNTHISRSSIVRERGKCMHFYISKAASISAPLGAKISQFFDEIVTFYPRKWPVLGIFVFN